MTLDAPRSYPVAATEAEVRAFYAKELGARGYEKKDTGAWERGSERVELTITGPASPLKVVVRQTRATAGRE